MYMVYEICICICICIRTYRHGASPLMAINPAPYGRTGPCVSSPPILEMEISGSSHVCILYTVAASITTSTTGPYSHAAIVAYTSNILQNDIGKYLGSI